MSIYYVRLFPFISLATQSKKIVTCIVTIAMEIWIGASNSIIDDNLPFLKRWLQRRICPQDTKSYRNVSLDRSYVISMLI